jgi:hypothetical protein
MKTKSLLLSVLLATFSMALTAKANLIFNGGFETGDFTGWSHTGNPGATGVSMSYANTDTYGAQLGPVGSDGYLSQTFATVVGDTYAVEFWLSNDGGNPNDFSASFGATTLLSLTDAPGFGFSSYTFNVVAASTSSTLLFSFRQDPRYWGLDDVSVEGLSSVPDSTSTFGLMLLGLVGVVALRRKLA